MAKPWYIQLDVNAYMADTAALSLAAMGFWQRALCVMFKNDRCGVISGTMATIAKLCLCTEEEAAAAVSELQMLHVTECNVTVTGVVTLVNRRMAREYKERKSNGVRVLRHRQKKEAENLFECNANVTGVVTVHSNSNSNSKAAAAATPDPTVPATPQPQPTAAVATTTEIPTLGQTAPVMAAAAAFSNLGIDEKTRDWALANHPVERIRAAQVRMETIRSTGKLLNPSGLLRTLLAAGCSGPVAAAPASGKSRDSPGSVAGGSMGADARRRKAEEERRLMAETEHLEAQQPLGELLRTAAAGATGKTRLVTGVMS